MFISPRLSAVLAALAYASAGQATNFTIINGQIFTPGLAIVNAPQPNTPLGGETLHLSIDVSGNGKLDLPPYADDAPTQLHSIRAFLTSYTTGLNLTISNDTKLAATAQDGEGVIMAQEEGSTVKHVNWIWPACFVGDGAPEKSELVSEGGSARGSYNVSFHQTFRLNDTEYFTVFDLPIAVTNGIEKNDNRSLCESLMNPLLGWEEVAASTEVLTPEQYPWTNGVGGSKVEGGAEDGSGAAGAVTIDRSLAALWAVFAFFAVLA